jgi:alanine racemase
MIREAKFDGRPVWAEIRLGALERNLRAIQKHIGAQRKIMAVVKAFAYGHGAVPVTKALAKAGAHWFAVTSTAEGVELREGGVRQPILVLTGLWPGDEKRLLQHRLTPSITRVEQLAQLERAAVKLRVRTAGVHLKVDTGMNRLGVAPSDVERFLRALGECERVRLAGTFTHFASSEDFTADQTERQERAFAEVLERLRAAGVDPGLVHLANSAAVASRPSTWADMVRPGALLYGYHQFYNPPERKLAAENHLPLEPILSFRARILSVKEVGPGQGVGYNARFVAGRRSRIGVMAAGYADGLLRQRMSGEPGASVRSRVIVRGRCAPIVGQISMDLTTVDVTDVPEAQVGDVVTIYGVDGQCAIWASQIAQDIGSVTADVLCALGRRVPRFYIP